MQLTELEGIVGPKFVAKIQVLDSGCWEWVRSFSTFGYGYFYDSRQGKNIRAHRWLYAQLNGDPGKLFVCHHCDNRKCVNPEHLFVGTNTDNMRDASQKGRLIRDVTRFLSATHCRKGHLITPETMAVLSNGKRQCRMCRRKRQLEWLRRRKADRG